ncbi:hypothetical protein SAMN05421770_102286 [Granulicella rosea]|uniref:Uncharacterized protein n=1 Tax=Granulicella rosea TaxID=474952 RepID=A0A239H9J9_9BACT|nr:hypothetical protein SAMN05421770_102286 [Granulicella rosea]
MNLFIPNHSNDIEGLLNVRGETFRDQTAYVRVDVLARLPQHDAQLLNT